MPEQDIPFNIYLISFAIGFVVGLILAIYFMIRGNIKSRQLKKEVARQKQMLQDRLEVELESVAGMKDKIKGLEEINSNLKRSLDALSQKATRQELYQLAVYQKAIDILTSQSPGFGPAWQNALENSREEVEQYSTGVKPFIRNIVKSVLPEEIE